MASREIQGSLFTFCKVNSLSLSVCSLAGTVCTLYLAAMSNNKANSSSTKKKKKPRHSAANCKP